MKKILQFDEIKSINKDGEYLAVSDTGKTYNATYTIKYGGVMFFCIPSYVNIIGYIPV